MTLRIPAKVLLHVWSYDFYAMTLSTGKQRRHMIRGNNENEQRKARSISPPFILIQFCDKYINVNSFKHGVLFLGHR